MPKLLELGEGVEEEARQGEVQEAEEEADRLKLQRRLLLLEEAEGLLKLQNHSNLVKSNLLPLKEELQLR